MTEGGGLGDGFLRSLPSLLPSLPSFLRRQESMPSAGQDKGMDPRIREDDGGGARQGDGSLRSLPSFLPSLPSFLRRQESMPSAGQDKGMDPRIREDDGVGARGWIPAFARMTESGRARGWIPAFARMTGWPTHSNHHKRLKSGNRCAGMRFASTSLKPLKNGWMCQ